MERLHHDFSHKNEVIYKFAINKMITYIILWSIFIIQFNIYFSSSPTTCICRYSVRTRNSIKLFVNIYITAFTWYKLTKNFIMTPIFSTHLTQWKTWYTIYHLVGTVLVLYHSYTTCKKMYICFVVDLLEQWLKIGKLYCVVIVTI